MAPPKVMHGARAKVYITYKDSTGNTVNKLVGVWMSFDYNVAYNVQDISLLGRFGPAALLTTGVSPVSITARSYRVIDHGPFADLGLANLKDLLNQEYVSLEVHDRNDETKVLARISGCLPTGYSTGVSAKQLAEGTNSYLGLIFEDESGPQFEVGATELPV